MRGFWRGAHRGEAVEFLRARMRGCRPSKVSMDALCFVNVVAWFVEQCHPGHQAEVARAVGLTDWNMTDVPA